MPATSPPTTPIPTAVLERVRALYDAGRYCTAWREATAHAPLEDWRDPEGRVAAGRLIRHVGDPRRGMLWLRLAQRDAPRHPLALYYAGYAVFSSRGPLAGWQWTEKHPLPEGAPAELEADWLALRANLLGTLRDFHEAEPRLNRALELAPTSPWIQVERAHLCELQDQVPQALEATARALELSPGFRPALQARAHLLGLHDGVDEALELLRDWAPQLECAALWFQLGSLLEELEQAEEARAAFERAGELLPAMGKHQREHLNARLSDTTYLCGDVPRAIELARAVSSEPKAFHSRVAEAMAEHPRGARRRLDVGFVRQDYMTCAPASVTMLANYFGLDLSHEAVADAICYDGTPAHAQRTWAQEQGWYTREFAATWEGTQALIDRGIPYAVSTVDPTSAHMQVVIGYDACRKTLLIRDPNARHYQECLAETWFEHYRAFGPRGVVLLPMDQRERLEGLELEDSARFDLLYELEAALFRHERAAAGEALERLLALGEDHRVALWGRRVVAAYDKDTLTALECLHGLSAQFPAQKKFVLDRLDCLDDRGTHGERRELLERALREQEDEVDPVFWWRLGAELQEDPEELARAEALLRRAIRYRPLEAMIYLSYAHLLTLRGRSEDALPLYRFAACLAPRAEGFALAYFRAARQHEASEAALDMLARRVERQGVKSSESARTLFLAYHSLDRTEDAFALLERALELRPEDGDLLVFAAEVHARHGQRAEADACLARAAGKVAPRDLALGAAEVARFSGELQAALERTREALVHDPRSLPAHSSLAALLAQTAGAEAAREHLAQAVAREPEYVPLSRLYLEWLSDAPDPEPAVEALRAFLERHPTDAWARRALALKLSELGRHEAALAEARRGRAAAPRESSGWAVEAQILRDAGRAQDARRAYAEAVALDADDRGAIAGYLDCSQTPDEFKDAASAVRAALLSQPITGQGILGYAYACRGRLLGEEQLAFFQRLSEVHGARWEAWSAWVDQLLFLGRMDEAVEVGCEGVERFPLRGELWLDLARARRDQGDKDGACEALRHVLAIDPAQTRAAGLLAELLIELGRLSDAEEALRQGLLGTPRHPFLLRVLAAVERALGREAQALETLRAALEVDPHDEEAWGLVLTWSDDEPGRAAAWARELAAARPRDVTAWVRAARLLPSDATEERLALLERAEAHAPRDVELHDNRAMILAEAERFDEARAACRPAVFGEEPPLPLRGREAWVLERSGDLRAAKARMKRLLHGTPDYAWGWRELAEWCHRADDADGQAEAARHLLELDPRDAGALCHLGAANQKEGQLADAARAYGEALAVDPRNVFAAQALFDLRLEAGDLSAAGAALEALERHLPDPFVALRRVQLEVARRARGPALRALRELWRYPQADPGMLRHAVELASEAGWDHALWRPLRDAIAEEGVHPVVGWLWARDHAVFGRWDAIEDALPALRERAPALAEQAAEAYLEQLGDRRRIERLRAALERDRAWYRGRDPLWASAGYALSQCDLSEDCVRWMADWTERDPAQVGWSYLSLATAAREAGRLSLARTWPSSPWVPTPNPLRAFVHWTWLHFDHVVGGRSPAPEVEHGLGPTRPALPPAVLALADSAQAPTVRARALLAQLREEFAFLPQAPLLVDAYLQTVRYVALRGGGGLLLWLWTTWLCWRVARQARRAQRELAAGR
ncbi:MAG: tetratricopeptide repeat protein [Planctomycetota bacterium]